MIAAAAAISRTRQGCRAAASTRRAIMGTFRATSSSRTSVLSASSKSAIIRSCRRARETGTSRGVCRMRVLLAQPRGFCAGVIRAIDIVEQALAQFGPPVYVRHEIVHNRHVVDTLRAKGARFVEHLREVPAGAITIFSAHGVAKAVEQDADARDLHVLDATCPLVAKVHGQGKRYVRQGRTVILVGHAGHPEVEGTLGQIPGPVLLVQTPSDVDAIDLPAETPVAYVTQTTLSVDDTRGV